MKKQKNRKNNSGVTLIALVITIIIIMILSGLSISTGSTLIRKMRISRIITSMTMVRAKASDIYEKKQFNDLTTLVGTKVESIPQLDNDEKTLIQLNANSKNNSVPNISEWEWYKWDKSVLESQKLDPNMLSGSECFYVNYETGEIVFSKSTTYKIDDEKKSYYSLSGLNKFLDED